MIDEIPCNIENIKIYNDYTYKQYILEKIDNKYNIVKSEYFPQYFMSERLKLQFIFRIPFFSFYSNSGKSTLIHRLTHNEFANIELSTIVLDYKLYNLEKYNNTYKGQFYDFNGQERSRVLSLGYAKNSNIAIFTINLYSNDNIDEDYINKIKELIKDNKLDNFLKSMPKQEKEQKI